MILKVFFKYFWMRSEVFLSATNSTSLLSHNFKKFGIVLFIIFPISLYTPSRYLHCNPSLNVEKATKEDEPSLLLFYLIKPFITIRNPFTILQIITFIIIMKKAVQKDSFTYVFYTSIDLPSSTIW